MLPMSPARRCGGESDGETLKRECCVSLDLLFEVVLTIRE
jgi:hypothetical protein